MSTIEVKATTTVQKPKKASAPKKPAAHPPFYSMVSDAIVTLNERTGSSQYAIAKFMEDKHKQLPSNFKKLLLVQLRRLVASGKLLKLKNSYKLPAATKAAIKAGPKKAAAATKAPAAKSKSVAKPKPKAKTATKTKATGAKAPTAGTKRKAPAKAATKPAKAAKTTAAGKKAPVAKKAAPAKKKAASKVKVPTAKKPKSVKTPVKKTPTKKAK